MDRQVGKKYKKSYPSKYTSNPKRSINGKYSYDNAFKIPRSIGSSAPLATRGFGDMSILKNREKKFFDYSNISGPWGINTTPIGAALHTPVLGSDYTNRIGRKTVIKSLYIRGRIQLQETDQPSGPTNPSYTPAQQCRMIVYVDFQPNGSAPALSDILNNSDPIGQLNPNNRDRFKIVKDKTWVFDPLYVNGDTITFNRTIYDFKVFKKLNLEVIYNSTNGGTIADIQTGALGIYFVGDNAPPPVEYAAICSFTSRTRFEDM